MTDLKSNFFVTAFSVFLMIAAGVAQTSAPKTQSPGKSSTKPKRATVTAKTYPPQLVQQGAAIFRQHCSFCHGRDATGGESGPDLTRSKLVSSDMNGDKIGPVVRNGRPEKRMPPFPLPDDQIASLVAFIHTQQQNGEAAGGRKGGRKGVDPEDLKTGNAEAGKQYFNGAGGCSNCHSPTGDLSGIASRYKGLELEERMLYPRRPKATVSVTLTSGQEISGTLAYFDEFTVGLTDSDGQYRSWRTRDVKYKVNAPAEAHVELFSKYTDADVHNLMAYLQTLQ
jgi:cytochrome c oxidase cbb3-type subunit III